MFQRLIVILFAVTCAEAEPKVSFEKIIRYQGDISGQSVEVTIRQGLYDFSGHKISGGESFPVDEPPKEFQPVTIDGVEFAGTDGISPFGDSNKDKMAMETISKITLNWGGQEINVPKVLHINLLCLTLDSDPNFRNFQFVPNSEGNALLLQAIGGDGGASYMASLILRKNGKHRQVLHGYWEDDLPSEKEAWNIALESKPEGEKKPKSESEGRTQ